VFVSTEGGNADIWVTAPDGSNRKQLTSNRAQNFSPVISANGRYIVFSSWRDGKKNLWRMNIDGSNLLRLTSGLSDSYPSFSPDGRWVVYTTQDGPKPITWKVSIDGGTPVQISDHVATMAAVSPDGRFIAYAYPESQDPFAPPNRLAVIPFEGGPAIKTFEIRGSGTVATVLQWAQDSNSILYSINANNVTNIWSQSLDGAQPKQVTNFTDLLMTSFAWSHDGKQLACTRGSLLRDAILITDLK
jgi:Tol biopolymer transport system component